MAIFIYPDNLTAKATLWLWELKDLAIVGIGLLLSVLALASWGLLPPLVLTVLYAFLSIRMEDASNLGRTDCGLPAGWHGDRTGNHRLTQAKKIRARESASVRSAFLCSEN